MSDVDEEVLVRIGDSGERVQIRAHPWERLHYLAFVILCSCKTEELLKRVHGLLPKVPADDEILSWTLGASREKLSAWLKTKCGQNKIMNLGPLIKTVFNNEKARCNG